MQSESAETVYFIDLIQAARDFAAEVGGTAERKKKSIPSPANLQTFFLYVRAQGAVPVHQVSGPITVQGLVGSARISAQGRSCELAPGGFVSIDAGIPHELSASTDSVLLVTHALSPS